MLLIFVKFAALCQWINENLCLNQASWYWQLNIQQNFWSIVSAFLNSLIFTHDFMNIDVAHAQYISVRSDEQKTCLTKNECFDCD